MKGYRWVWSERPGSIKAPGGEWVYCPTRQLELDLMPRLPEDYLDTVAFLYPSEDAAKEGAPGGATGFLVAHPGDGASMALHPYVVTNKHCLRDGLTIRVTTRSSGSTEPGVRTIVTKECDWIKHPDGYDVAVYHIQERGFGFGDPSVAMFGVGAVAPFWMFGQHNIGPGHDVYVGARVIGIDSPHWNIPVLVSGIVSTLPLYGVPKLFEEPAFLVEMRGRVGYSGAPVFARITPEDSKYVSGVAKTELLFLVGVFSHHIPTFEPVIDKASSEGQKTGHFVRVPSALGIVVPAWEIHDILTGEKAMAKRKEVEQRWNEEGNEEVPSAEAEEAYAESTLGPTADLLENLFGVPKDEADEVHKGHSDQS